MLLGNLLRGFVCTFFIYERRSFSNRRPPAEVPHDAIIVRSAGEPTFTPPSRPRKRKLGLGNDSRGWIEKIRRGDILPLAPIEEKLSVFIDMLKKVEASGGTFKDCMNKAKNIAFERYECPVCKNFFNSRMDCMEHLDQEHPLARVEKPMFCEICLKAFADKKAIEQHESYHRQIQVLVETGELEVSSFEVRECILISVFSCKIQNTWSLRLEMSRIPDSETT